MKKLRQNLVPIVFFILSIIGITYAKVSFGFIANELYLRIIRNSLMVLALIIPITAGMGLNFAIVIGALASQTAMIFVIDQKILGPFGLLLTVLISIILSLVLGKIVGMILNKSKGKEMITSIVIGLIGTSIYQLIFMVGYGTVIKAKTPELLLSNGIGIRNMVDILEFKTFINKNKYILWVTIILASLIILYIMNSKLGAKFKAIGANIENAYALGINVDKVRTKAIMISTVIASLGHIMFMIDLGNINVYTGHMNLDVFSAAAILAGGATLKRANIKNCFIGIVLFHSLFIVSPLAGQNLFESSALGEYFRSFIAYATIVFAVFIQSKFNEKYENTYYDL